MSHLTIVRRAAIAVASIAFLGAFLASAVPELNGIGDVNLYRDIGDRVHAVHVGARTTVQSEYPPLATSVFWIASRLPFSSGASWAYVVFVLIGAGIVYTSVVGKESDGVSLAVGIFLSVQLLSVDLGFGRFDVLIALLLALTWVAFRSKRYGTSAFFLTVAAMLKVVPVFLLPFLLLSVPKSGLRRTWVGIAAGAAFSAALPLLVLGPAMLVENTSFFLRYHSERGVQHESTLSGFDALYRWFHGTRPNIVFSHSAHENASISPLVPKIGTVVILLLLACVFAVVWRKRRIRAAIAFDTLAISILFGMLSLAPVLSPQYFMWVLPLVFMWCAERLEDSKWRPRVAVALAIAFFVGWLTYLVYKAGIEKGIVSLIVLHNVRSALLFCAAGFFYASFHRGTSIFAPRRGAGEFSHLRKSIAVIALCFAVLAYVFAVFKPSISEVRYRHSADAEFQSGALPLFVPSNGPDVFVTLAMDLSYVHPLMFRVKPDDCLRNLVINGTEVDRHIAGFCDYGHGRDLDLAKYLRPGRNELHFDVHDEGGGLGGATISMSESDPVFMALKLAFAALLAWFVVVLLRIPAIRSRFAFFAPFFAGVFLRVLYAASADYRVHGHDTDGHVDYIRYVAEHMWLPPADAGWEFHQAPLYYFLTGAWYAVADAGGFSEGEILRQLQHGSLLLSFLSLGIALWIVGRFLSKKNEAVAALCAGMIIATLPSWIFASLRLGNDALYQPLALGAVALSLRWWKGGSIRSWYGACTAFALAFLTKASALALAPLLAALFVFRRGWSWKSRLLPAVASVSLVVLLAGWLPVYRLLEPNTVKTLSLGNDGMSGDLRVENSLKNFSTFNPVGITHVPFNNPWDDAHRRQFYWEYLYRSAFFGEFGFDGKIRGTAVMVLFFGFIALVAVAMGIAKQARSSPRELVPSALFAAVLLLSSVLYRLNFPYAPNQDFRFVVIAIVPLACLAARGALVRKDASPIFAFSLWGLAASSALFIVLYYAVPA